MVIPCQSALQAIEVNKQSTAIDINYIVIKRHVRHYTLECANAYRLTEHMLMVNADTCKLAK